MPVIITDCGPDHQYAIKANDIRIVNSAYFGNDADASDFYPTHDDYGEEIQQQYLNIGYF